MWHIVSPEYPPHTGGIASWTRGVAHALHQAGEPVQVYVRARGLSPWPEEPFPVQPIYGRAWKSWQGIWAALALRLRLQKGDQILCATWPLSKYLLGISGVKTLIAFHGTDLSRPENRAACQPLLSQAHALLPVSDYLGSLLGRPYHRLPMPILPQPQARPGPVLLCIARLHPLKGVDRVLRLGHRLGWPVVVVGDGPERSRLELLAQELGGTTRFTGSLPPEQIPWDGSRALALLSRTEADGSGAEGLGLVLLEAASRGIPTIGSTTGGIPEAASIVLADPERDLLPDLPENESVQRWLYQKHGAAHTVEVLRAVVRTATTV